jgi:hypothetical protein
VLLGPAGAVAYGEPALSLFRELRFFGGELPEPTPLAAVSPRLWTVREGEALRQRRHLDLRGPGPWRLTLRPPASLASATRLGLDLRAPAGSRLVIEGLGPAGEDVALSLDEDARNAEPGATGVGVPLSPGWAERLPLDGLSLRLSTPDGAGARFEGATFGFESQPSDDGASDR